MKDCTGPRVLPGEVHTQKKPDGKGPGTKNRGLRKTVVVIVRIRGRIELRCMNCVVGETQWWSSAETQVRRPVITVYITLTHTSRFHV